MPTPVCDWCRRPMVLDITEEESSVAIWTCDRCNTESDSAYTIHTSELLSGVKHGQLFAFILQGLVRSMK